MTMLDSEKTAHLSQPGRSTRPTLGLFTYGLLDTISEAVWKGIEDAAREHDVNLVCYCGGSVDDATGVNLSANILYDFVSTERIDGLIIWVAVVHFLDLEAARAFYRRYAAYPVVSIGFQVEGIPTVIVDNYAGMYSAVNHLVEVHGYSRIAFIRGPEGHEEAEERYRAYQDVLAAHGLALDPTLITPGNNQRQDGARAVEILFSERRLRPQVDVEAVVAANDNMALGALDALQARGIRVPDEVALVGFDDFEEGRYTFPPLTSVPWEGYAQGRQAVEVLLALLAHEEVPSLTRVPTDVIVRESCGCVVPDIVRAAEAPDTRSPRSRAGANIAAARQQALAEVTYLLPSLRLDKTQLDGWVEAFIAELAAPPTPGFIPTMQTLVRQTIGAGGDVNAWHTALSVLRRQTLPYLREAALRSRAENLWQQARTLIGHATYQTQARLAWLAASQARAMRYVTQALLDASELREFAAILPQQMASLGLPGCSLVLFETPEKLTNARLLVARDGVPGREAPIFPARLLLPDAAWHQENRFSRVLEVLQTRGVRLGYVLFEVGPLRGDLYGALRDQIGYVLRGLLLVEELRRAQTALQKAYAEVEQQVAIRTEELQHEIAARETLYERRAHQVLTSTLISQEIAAAPTLDELYRRVVTLIKERFEYDHAQIFRYDPQVHALRLVVGYGEVGQKMLAEGHQLELGVGVVGTAAETGTPILATDVTQDRDWRPNPNLPGTRGELAVPIKLRDQVFGILDVQSNRAGALTLDDQLLLEQLCGQIAIAIENTRLREEMEERLQMLNMVQESLSREGWEVLRAQHRDLKGYAYDRGVVYPLTQTPAASYTVPVVMAGGQVVGRVGVQEDPTQPLTPEERALLATISEQVAEALDRARLFEDTRRSAARDQIISELSAQMRASLDIDEVLQTAVREMVGTLNFAKVEVRLGVSPANVSPENGTNIPPAGETETPAAEEGNA
ncbi:MAG TPA: substrate-binding domain-containing protein [Anaerolineae bacterium]|nr:substrate-binding domain-containing protein [Anaerolineae bacterium]HQK13019.1 substrate-binding domain-containing protein [Anaerolineae bacterium]